MEHFEIKNDKREGKKFVGFYIRESIDEQIDLLKKKTGCDKRTIVEQMIEFAVSKLKNENTYSKLSKSK